MLTLELTNIVPAAPVGIRAYTPGCTLVEDVQGTTLVYRNHGPTAIQLTVEPYFTTNQTPCVNYNILGYVSLDLCAPALNDLLEDNDTCLSAAPVVPGALTGLQVSPNDQDFYSWCVPAGDRVEFTTTSAQGTLELYLWDRAQAGCGMLPGGAGLLAQDTDHYIVTQASWTNTTGAPVEVAAQVLMLPSGGSLCSIYDLYMTSTGSCDGLLDFCYYSLPNAAGQYTHLGGSWGSGAGSGLHLSADQGPPGQFAYFLVGDAIDPAGTTISNGILCLATTPGHQIGRYNQTGVLRGICQFNAAGHLVNQSGTSTTGFGFDVPSLLPFPGNNTIQVGQTWNFQLWHRDSALSSYFSNGLEVTF
ncbi:MAG: hypothetical protein R3E96_01615 [Planctomycetota bacterium]